MEIRTVRFLGFVKAEGFVFRWLLGFGILSMTIAPGAGAQEGAPAVSPAETAVEYQRQKAAQAADYEDSTSPGLGTSHLVATPPIAGEKDDLEQYTRELLQLQWRAGDPLDLYVIKPKGVEKPPVIIYLYGHPEDTDRFQDEEFCKLLVKGGYAALGFAPGLSGHRFHDRPMKEWYVSELQETLAESAHDVQMVLNYAASRGDLDMRRVGFFGQGSGATIGILAAAVDPRIQVLDLMDPWGDWPEWMAKSTRIPDDERPNFVKPEFLKKVAGLDTVDWLPKLKTQTVRVQIVDYDTITPPEAKKAIAAAVPSNMLLVRYENGNQLHDALAMGHAFDWVKAKMGESKK